MVLDGFVNSDRVTAIRGKGTNKKSSYLYTHLYTLFHGEKKGGR